jgi:hypothetical protein
MYDPGKAPHDPRLGRNVSIVTRRTHDRSRTAHLAIGGVSGIVAIMMIIGLIIARLTTSTRNSAEAVVTDVTIVGALIAGFLAAPLVFGRTFGADRDKHQDHD